MATRRLEVIEHRFKMHDVPEVFIANEGSTPEALLYSYPDAQYPLTQIVGYTAGAEDIAINY